MKKLEQLATTGQSIWLDYIRRAFLTNGDLQSLVDEGVRGVTSNPAIFEKAIAGSADYDADLRRLAEAGHTTKQIYEELALEDIRLAAEILRPVYERTQGLDGYVSFEVNPMLAHDTAGTIEEATRIYALLGCPNVMIKVPATPAGIPAIQALIGKGINVNVTLIFSVAQYEAVAQAYLSGLEHLLASGGDVSRVASVASFFISRVDSAVEQVLTKRRQQHLAGLTAVANAKVAYERFRLIFSGVRWQQLAALGARVQRLLWASTGVKNPALPDTFYVTELIGADTVNTLPPATLRAFLDHGEVQNTLGNNSVAAQQHLDRLTHLGIDLNAITDRLLQEGVAAFVKAFEELMASIAAKRDCLIADVHNMQESLGAHRKHIDAALATVRRDNIMARIWDHDHTVWNSSPDEIANRLGWLHMPDIMIEQIWRFQELRAELRSEGYNQVVLLGMGGSSLAPEVFRKTFGVRNGALDLTILDSTHPETVLSLAERLELTRTLFIVATKSGSTVETFSLFKFFYNRVAALLGSERAGEHFIAITDPGSGLADTATKYNFRTTFLNDPNIGGRYSALSYFGLVPAALVGVELRPVLQSAQTAVCNSEGCNCPILGDNLAARLGVIMGAMAQIGRDKLTLITSPTLASFGDWVEQLIAESTGKNGRGILPVVGEPIGKPDVYGQDRLFVYLRLENDPENHPLDIAIDALEKAGHPVVRLRMRTLQELGSQFFLWEMATAVAGWHLGINPFDQPNVEAAKVLARQLVDAYTKTGQLPAGETAPLSAATLTAYLAEAEAGRSYVAIQAYLPPSVKTDAALRELRTSLRDATGLATTVGYGPRFLHSTGQLHKGDGGQGLFIQLTADHVRDAAIPMEAGSTVSELTFGALITAQALGDAAALRQAGRQVIHFDLGWDVLDGLRTLQMGLAQPA